MNRPPLVNKQILKCLEKNIFEEIDPIFKKISVTYNINYDELIKDIVKPYLDLSCISDISFEIKKVMKRISINDFPFSLRKR